MRAFMAVAESDEPFKPICIETLTEICEYFLTRTYMVTESSLVLIDVDLMARTGGIRLLLHALAEGSPEMAPMISSAFLHIADSPRTRQYLHLGTDLEVSYNRLCI